MKQVNAVSIAYVAAQVCLFLIKGGQILNVLHLASVRNVLG